MSTLDNPPENAHHNSFAFVIRIWLEDEETMANPMLWRGHITQVIDQRKHYFEDLSGIISFITPYLELWNEKHRPE